MSLFNAINGGLESMFKELAKSKGVKQKRRYLQFKELEYTPYLLDSSYLLELSEGANAAEQGMILDYLYRFNNRSIGEEEHLNILGIESYKNVEQNLIDRKWK